MSDVDIFAPIENPIRSSDPPADPEAYPISVRGLVKRYGDQTVLNGVNLDVAKGETMVIMGGSGCGKSTTLRCMIGSVTPEEGRIFMFGGDIVQMHEEQLNEVRKKIGILFQSGALFNSMTLRENVALPLEEHTTLTADVIEIMVTIKLELVGLREHAEKYPSALSGGQKKRAGLARATALDPQILFYDEPSAGLDPVTSAEIDLLMKEMSQRLGVTSVVVTHEMDSAFTIADRMCMLDHGRVLAVRPRAWFEAVREYEGELPEAQALIRQFLRGSAEGPLTDRRQTSSYAEELLRAEAPALTRKPAVKSSR